jgi:hypothetical protein
MPATVCTLFENRYHLGVAVLVNSLARAGYAGEVHAGFRGPLPPWANDATQRDATTWEFPVTPQLRILFIRLQTTAHFANYKPDLILQTLAKTNADAVLYFDPDVVVNTTWRYIEEWLSCGVALCDDVNSPLPENHPRRIGWRRFFRTQGQELRFRGAPYANSGVVGVPRIHSSLLEVWRGMQTAASASLGGPDVVGIGGGRNLAGAYGFADCFRQPDQDTLNAALEACPDIPVSFLGRQAMGFDAGTPFFPHATGTKKPWNRRYVREALSGRPPVRVDKIFWSLADSPLHPFSARHVAVTRRCLTIGAGLGRLIRRS